MDIKAQTYKLIDDLKAVCHNYGMGNDGNEYKVITQIFLFKFLNDKFGYEIKKKDSRIASAEKWETAYSELPEDDQLDLLDSLSPDIPRLYPEHLISTLWNQQAKGDFDFIFDSTMVDIADKNIDIFSTQTTKNTKIPLFEKLTNFVTDDAQRAHLQELWLISLSISLLRTLLQRVTISLQVYLSMSSRITTQTAVAYMRSTTRPMQSP